MRAIYENTPSYQLMNASDILVTMNIFNQEYNAFLLRGFIHNFAGPLTTLIGYAQLLSKNQPEPSRETSAMTRAAMKIESILTNLSIRADLFTQERVRTVDINDIISIELSYFEADPIFKHSLTKRILLQSHLPLVIIKPRYFIMGLDILMQSLVMSARIMDASTFELQTFTRDQKIWIKVELSKHEGFYPPSGESCSSKKDLKDIINVSVDTIRSLRKTAFSILRQVYCETQEIITENTETLLLGINENSNSLSEEKHEETFISS